MISLIRLTDNIEIKYLLLKDNLYKGLLDPTVQADFSLDILNSSILYKAIENNQVVGLFLIQEFMNNCLRFHAGVYKQFRHQKSHEYLKDCIELMRKEFNCTFMTTILKTNEPALKATMKAGFVIKAELKNASKSGDVIILGEE
jgi:hypothetical protein